MSQNIAGTGVSDVIYPWLFDVDVAVGGIEISVPHVMGTDRNSPTYHGRESRVIHYRKTLIALRICLERFAISTATAGCKPTVGCLFV